MSLRKRIFPISVALFAFVALMLAFALMRTPAKPRLEITMDSSSPGESLPKEFRSWDSSLNRWVATTQDCYSAQVRFQNTGKGQIVLADYWLYVVEIQKRNSTTWQQLYEPGPAGESPALAAGAHIIYPISIPHDAERWRIVSRYRRWQALPGFLNYLCGFLNIDSDFGDQNVYRAESEIWEMNPQK